MSTNYDLRKALYSFLDVKVDSSNQIVILNSNKFKAVKVEAGSVVNIFISAQKPDSSANSIYINALSSSNVNEYYSDFLIKVYWSEDNIIYILNDDDIIDINSIFVEFLKGKLVETYLVSDTTVLSDELITVDSNNINRINYKNESLTFKSEYDTLVVNFTNFSNNYNAWKATLGAYAQVDKLVSDDTEVLIGKNKRISDYISDSSIHSGLLIDDSILRDKLKRSANGTIDVLNSLELADSSVQSIKLNNGVELNVSGEANITALTKLKIKDFNASTELNPVYKEYTVGSDGIISISDWSDYLQPRLQGNTGELLYFSENNVLSNVSMNTFLLDSDILLYTTDPNVWESLNVNNNTVPSSLLVKNALDGKVNKINRTAVSNISFLKVSVSDQGLVTANTNVSQTDLTNIIGNYYLTVSYEFDSVNGELKLL